MYYYFTAIDLGKLNISNYTNKALKNKPQQITPAEI